MRADLAIGSWASDNGDVLKALGTFLFWVVIALLVDRWFASRGHRLLAERILKGGISQQADTRLRFIRRLVWLGILAIGLLLALTQFTGIQRVAASLLASGALAAAIIGFAARQTLANFVAGVMLAITQPLRVGDWVTFEDHYGVVEDVRLNYTILRTAGEKRLVIPNERLASGILLNDTLQVDAVGLEVTLWIPPGADSALALELLRDESGADVSVAETVPSGVRLAVAGEPVAPAEHGAAEADLRARCHARLRAAGLLEGFPAHQRS